MIAILTHDMGQIKALSDYTETIAAWYIQNRLTYEDFKADTVADAINTVHVSSAARLLAMQSAVLMADMIAKPIFDRQLRERAHNFGEPLRFRVIQEGL